MNKSFTWIAALTLCGFFFACTPTAEQTDTAQETETAPLVESSITLTPLQGSPAFPEASLSLTGEPTAGDAESYRFDFEVDGYTLGEQTSPETPNGLANSGKGQHIHLIVDNGPYSAHYEPTFSTQKLATLENHVVLAFLSRSYHESVKNVSGEKTSFVVTQVNRGEGEGADLSAPHMFYSRPKGTYTGEGAQKVLLDFFLLNTDLSPDGNRIRATINDAEFMIDKWQPYVIEGAPLGTLKVKLELLDGAGNLVESPFNPVEREVTLAAATE